MKTFLAVFRGEPSKGNEEWNALSQDQMDIRVKKGIDEWGKWMHVHSSKIIYPGGPLGKTLQVNKDGISSKVNNDCGFVIVNAESHDEAAKMFINHPHFSIFPGENVEIMECLPLPS